jgi:predicted nucleic acid-binding protein
MSYLVDTGVLLRLYDADDPDYRLMLKAIRTLWERKSALFVAVQNLAEFCNVSTRPIDKNGYGLSPEKAFLRMSAIERFSKVVPEDAESFRIWKELITTHSVSGVAVHDARLASVMISRGIANVLTLNVLTLNGRDFRRYAGISIVTPSMI